MAHKGPLDYPRGEHAQDAYEDSLSRQEYDELNEDENQEEII